MKLHQLDRLKVLARERGALIARLEQGWKGDLASVGFGDGCVVEVPTHEARHMLESRLAAIHRELEMMGVEVVYSESEVL